MTANEFYNNGIGEDIEKAHKNIIIELMENYAKHYHVSQQRELLIAFREWMRLKHYEESPTNDRIDEFLTISTK